MGVEGHRGGRLSTSGIEVLINSRAQAIARWTRHSVAAVLCALLLGCGLAEAGASETATAVIREDATLTFLQADGSPITAVRVEIAQTPEAIRRGLMFRELTDERQGMLFIYDEAQPRAFWMRNTPTSLDIIFVGSDRRVINIAARTRPYSDRSHRSAGSAQFVVEVRAGFAERHGIAAGTRIEWQERSSLDKIRLDLSAIDENGLVGPPGGKRLLQYELCLPRDDALVREALLIDPSLEVYARSPGRIGCSDQQVLAIGHTGLPGYEARLLGLARLPYVERIEQAFFE
jgi:uncharacterized membrane protein (UPF0127 family)